MSRGDTYRATYRELGQAVGAFLAFEAIYKNKALLNHPDEIWYTVEPARGGQFMDRASPTARFFLLASLLLSSATFAQSYQSGKVVQFGATQRKGSQQWVFQYLVRVDDKTVYEITRHNGKMELNAQQTVKYRLEKNRMYIVATNGKVIRFDIVPQK